MKNFWGFQKKFQNLSNFKAINIDPSSTWNDLKIKQQCIHICIQIIKNHQINGFRHDPVNNNNANTAGTRTAQIFDIECDNIFKVNSLAKHLLHICRQTEPLYWRKYYFLL